MGSFRELLKKFFKGSGLQAGRKNRAVNKKNRRKDVRGVVQKRQAEKCNYQTSYSDGSYKIRNP
jgi:hypothetical protein